MENRRESHIDGYLVVLAGFISTFVTGGLLRASPLVYQQILEKYESSKTEAAWVFALALCIGWAGGWLAMEFTTRWGSRFAYIIAGILKGLTFIACGFSLSIYYIMVIYGILQAFSVSLVFAAIFSSISQHFDKNKGKATGISCIGTPLGGVAFAPLVQLLFDKYGYQSSMLILGAVSFHICIAGTIVRPSTKPVEKKQTSSHGEDSLSEVLKNVCFLIFLLHLFLQKIENGASLTFISGLATESGLTLMQSAVIVSAGSGCGLAGKIGFGFLYDIKSIRNKRAVLYGVIAALSSLTELSYPIGNTYVILGIKHGVHMLMVGGHTIQYATVAGELVGTKNLKHGVGLSGMCSATGCLVGLVIGGALKDTYGTYNYSYYCGGGMGLLGCVMLLLSLLIKYLSKTEPCSDT